VKPSLFNERQKIEKMKPSSFNEGLSNQKMEPSSFNERSAYPKGSHYHLMKSCSSKKKEKWGSLNMLKNIILCICHVPELL